MSTMLDDLSKLPRRKARYLLIERKEQLEEALRIVKMDERDLLWYARADVERSPYPQRRLDAVRTATAISMLIQRHGYTPGKIAELRHDDYFYVTPEGDVYRKIIDIIDRPV